jgi:hypothetical protein
MNKMKLTLFILLLGFIETSSQEIIQERVNKEFYYIEVDIRSSSSHPIIMAGVSEYVDLNRFSLEKDSLFIKSFYETSFYVPDLQQVYKTVFTECESSSNNNIKKIYSLISQISNNSIEKKLILENGSNVFLKICKLRGEFCVLDSRNKNIPKNSNEIDIDNIIEIKKCYIPVEILCVLKPKKKEIR